jgi:HKD family nuclease
MNYEFHVQDPTSPDTVYLFEAIIDAAQDATELFGIFAFATLGGVRALVTDPIVQSFLDRGGHFHLIVGIDAVTNRQTLEYLLAFDGEHLNATVRVFWNDSAGLFHPKLMHFRYGNGGEVLIVGSGNLTPGGWRENFEAYTVLRSRAREAIDVSSMTRFLARHDGAIRAIDEEALERAGRNLIRGGRIGRRRPVEVEPEVVEAALEAVVDAEEVPAPAVDRVLVAQVPAAGGRWHQVHFNQAVIAQFFQVRADSTQRVYLVERRFDGTRGDEEVRPCIYSTSNKNYKIELGGRRHEDYPAVGVPIAIFRETHARSFEYMLIMPGEPGHAELQQLLTLLPHVGRGLPRAITDTTELRAGWPGSPLLAV